VTPADTATPAEDATAGQVTPAELRTLFLFERLADDQLAWLSDRGQRTFIPAGQPLYVEREPAETLFVVLSGTVAMSQNVRGDNLEVSRTDQRGVYGGATQAYLGERAEQVYLNTLRAVTDVECFTLPAADFAALMREWYPLPMHLLEGLFLGMRNVQSVVGQRERLLALGQLSAGLTHELNNPAAAAGRATAALRERVAGMRHKLAMLAAGELDRVTLQRLTELQEAAVERAAKAPALSPMQAGDREDELADWLDRHGVIGSWDVAPVLIAAGLDTDWAEEVAAVSGDCLDSALRFLTYTLETESLMSEIEEATARISNLVGAAKQYSQMDRAPHQVLDVHEGLESTLVMLGRKIGDGVTVVRDYDRSLPPVPVYAAELNQVWTNLIDNALGAMGGTGTLSVRTARDGERLLVEIGDTGPGVPEHIRSRIFEPFFTTKPLGEGTGLGLDISWRIVVTKHHGDLAVVSEPGDTRFQVRLPLRDPEPPNG